MTMSEQSEDAIARVYHDGEHVADLHTMRLYHEFNEYPAYEVELLKERTEAVA